MESTEPALVPAVQIPNAPNSNLFTQRLAEALNPRSAQALDAITPVDAPVTPAPVVPEPEPVKETPAPVTKTEVKAPTADSLKSGFDALDDETAAETKPETFTDDPDVTGFVSPDTVIPAMTEFYGHTIHDYYDADKQELRQKNK